MKKLVALSTKEALLIQSCLTDHAAKASCILSHSDDYPSNVLDQVLDDLDLCDSIRCKLSKVFLDLSKYD